MSEYGSSLYPIPVVNDVDNEPLDSKFNYTEFNVDTEGTFKEKHRVSWRSHFVCMYLAL